jgi:hypothetical protein
MKSGPSVDREPKANRDSSAAAAVDELQSYVADRELDEKLDRDALRGDIDDE